MTIDMSRNPPTLHIPDNVIIIGCGGVGAWVAIALAMAGVKRMTLYDDDVLEAVNLNRLPFREDQIGRKKVLVLSDFITEIRPDCSVVPVVAKFRLNSLNDISDNSIIIECTDDLDFQEQLFEHAKEDDIKVVSVHYDTDEKADNISVHLNPQPSDWGERQNSYSALPSFVAPAMMAGALAAEIICRGVNKSIFLTFSKSHAYIKIL